MSLTQETDNGAIIAIVGKARKGKSTIAQTIGWLTDRNVDSKFIEKPRFVLKSDYFPKDFKLEDTEIMPRIVFKPSHVMKFLAEKHSRGSVIVWDETGVEGDARDYMSKKNKLLKRTVETIGSKNYILILTAPSLKSFDTGFRRMVNFIIKAKGMITRKDGSVWTSASILATRPNELTGDVFFKNLFIREQKFGGRGKIANYLFPSPPEFIEKPYKRMKELYQNALYTDYKNELEHMDDLNFAKVKEIVEEKGIKKMSKQETIINALINNPMKYLNGTKYDLQALKKEFNFSYTIIADAVRKYKNTLEVGATVQTGSSLPVAPLEKN